ncbi:MAG TPA: YfhO family protein, partial [Longimicrobiales bacterium]
DAPINLITSQLKLADVTNTVYLVSPQPIEALGLTEVFRGTSSVVYRKDTALPRAYLVSQVEVVPESLAVTRLLSAEFDPRRTAILAQPLPAGVNVQSFTQDTVRWLERGNSVQRLQVSADAPALLVVLDNYYKAWHAEVDGREVPLLRANHTFRAIPVPAGQHEVVMRYSSETVATWATVSGVILLVLLLAAFVPPLRDRLRSA